MNARKHRTTISSDLLRVIRNQLLNEKSNKEIAEMNAILISCAKNLANKISHGQSDQDIIHKHGHANTSNNDVQSHIRLIVQNDNALRQQGIVDTS